MLIQRAPAAIFACTFIRTLHIFTSAATVLSGPDGVDLYQRKIMYRKGDHLDFSHLTELKKYIYITEIYMKKKNDTNQQ